MMIQKMNLSLLLLLSCMYMVFLPSHALMSTTNTASSKQPRTMANNNARNTFGRILQSSSPSSSPSTLVLQVYNDDEEKEQVEEARVRIWGNRRYEVRGMLKSAERLRNFRNANGFVPELDEDGKAVKSDGKSAVTLTAFAVTAGAIVLRVGGRAALVSAVGLDFMNDNPDMTNQINQVLEVAQSVDPLLKAGLFCFGWTLVKTLCFDAGGIVLAFSSGILFGGVIQGAVMSALGATIGSSVAFGLAKADTPIRKKAIEIVEENPSLRGLEKVVADEGLKAVLTLRLAPVLPIPLGMYNYVYGISNVRFTDFAGGIFLGSLKPYFLDSYLGYFGKSLVDGTANDGGMQDYLLIGVLGFSVLIGVFASQLASETWDAVLKEQEAEEKERKLKDGDFGDDDDNEGITTEIFGWELPQWTVGFQYGLQDADERMNTLVLQEFDAKVWNCTEDASIFGMEISKSDLPRHKNPALIDPTSPEITEKYEGVNFGSTTCDGLVLSPILFSYFLKFADPLFDETEFQEERDLENDAQRESAKLASATTAMTAMAMLSTTAAPDEATTVASDASSPASSPSSTKSNNNNEQLSPEFKEGILVNQLQKLKDETKQRLEEANKKLEQLNNDSESL